MKVIILASLLVLVNAKARPEYCSLPPETGFCRAYFIRYYYNGAENACLEFVYGGCNPNLNNFKTIEECQDACNEEEVEPSENTAASEMSSPPSSPDMSVVGRGKEESTNPEDDSPSAHDCFSLPQSGNCRAIFERYFFNTVTGKCEDFTYGGCGGNNNNYLTLEECQAACEEAPGPVSDVSDVDDPESPADVDGSVDPDNIIGAPSDVAQVDAPQDPDTPAVVPEKVKETVDSNSIVETLDSKSAGTSTETGSFDAIAPDSRNDLDKPSPDPSSSNNLKARSSTSNRKDEETADNQTSEKHFVENDVLLFWRNLMRRLFNLNIIR